MLLTPAELLVASNVSPPPTPRFKPLFWFLTLSPLGPVHFTATELVTAVFKSTLSYQPRVCVGL